jgi:hypothetical protein
MHRPRSTASDKPLGPHTLLCLLVCIDRCVRVNWWCRMHRSTGHHVCFFHPLILCCVLARFLACYLPVVNSTFAALELGSLSVVWLWIYGITVVGGKR